MPEQRFMIRSFGSCAGAEGWLNSLDERFVLRAATDTPQFFTVVVENTSPRVCSIDVSAAAEDALEEVAA